MSCTPEKPISHSPLKLWSNNKKALNKIFFTMRLQSLPKHPPPPTQPPSPCFSPNPKPNKSHDFVFLPELVFDRTSLLSDDILLKILSKLPATQRNSNSLVSKRWLNLQGRLVRSVKILDWDFLVSGRLFFRFPNLVHVDLVQGSLLSPRNSGTLCSHKFVAFYVDTDTDTEPSRSLACERFLLSTDDVDSGLRNLANGCPNLRRLVVMNASEMGLLSVAEECPTLQELELHKCNDQVLRGIAAFQNLQILKLIANLDGIYTSGVSDVGLTILAQGCKRLVKLELNGCQGSYDGIRAIGQCCQMLEELILANHQMEDGWLSALSFCENLKTLRFLSCKNIDLNPGCHEHLGSCPTLERLHFEKCHLRDKQSIIALFIVCQGIRELIFRDCWGLNNEVFSVASNLRRVKLLSLEGCSVLTTAGLEVVVLSWMDLQSLKVMSCNKIKDSEISPVLSYMFSTLEDLQWRPDTKSLLASNLGGTGMGKRGAKYFKKTCDWKSLPGSQPEMMLSFTFKNPL
ncbi:OLC1v1027167C1 [Oldenlandia corymbosa var. corymbosa]|uniref:OLC1v1027167C1 n=1 Tax=Oldenlandia corymbosa var. corymbosa TaxID=529605 RepID=A0AAV1C9K1_OLDCO|nr:OLC1v1027167C1 [Oldenlandia corymbosa var. corymbosa]